MRSYFSQPHSNNISGNNISGNNTSVETQNSTDTQTNTSMIILNKHKVFTGMMQDLYHYGMKLIDNVSLYFNGEGRRVAVLLQGDIALFYRNEVKSLSFKTMQMASWLLLERALQEQDMSKEHILLERSKVILDTDSSFLSHPFWNELPESFCQLALEILHFTRRIHTIQQETLPSFEMIPPHNPIHDQLLKLEKIFSSDKTI